MSQKNLGDILLELGAIDQMTLNRALQLQQRRLGEILVEEDFTDPETVAKALKLQAKAGLSDLDSLSGGASNSNSAPIIFELRERYRLS